MAGEEKSVPFSSALRTLLAEYQRQHDTLCEAAIQAEAAERNVPPGTRVEPGAMEFLLPVPEVAAPAAPDASLKGAVAEGPDKPERMD